MSSRSGTVCEGVAHQRLSRCGRFLVIAVRRDVICFSEQIVSCSFLTWKHHKFWHLNTVRQRSTCSLAVFQNFINGRQRVCWPIKSLGNKWVLFRRYLHQSETITALCVFNAIRLDVRVLWLIKDANQQLFILKYSVLNVSGDEEEGVPDDTRVTMTTQKACCINSRRKTTRKQFPPKVLEQQRNFRYFCLDIPPWRV